MKCVVNGCETKYIGDGAVSFHQLYHNGRFKEEWIEAIRLHNRQEIDRSKKNIRICSSHFEKKCLLNFGFQNRLVAGAVPTIFPVVEKVTATNQSSNSTSSTPKSSDHPTLSETQLVDESLGAATLQMLKKGTPREMKHRLVQKARILKFIQLQLERRKKQNGKLTNTIFGLQRFRPVKKHRSRQHQWPD